MTEVTRPDAGPGLTVHAPLRAIALKLVYVALLTAMLAVVKALGDVPVGEVVFFRCLISIIPIWLWLRWRGERILPSFRTRRPWGHVTRAALGLVSMTLTFVAVRSLPLPEAVTLQYAQPLFVVAFSAILLGERVRLFRWSAVALGFAGVLVITWPSLTLLAGGTAGADRTALIGAGAALTAAATFAFTLLLLRQLVHTERSTTIVLWFWLLATLGTGATAVFGWEPLSLAQLGLLVLCGFLGGAGQMVMAESLRFAPASTTAAFEYTSIIFATALGYALFGDVLRASTLVGGAMVIAAGLLIFWRERMQSKSSVPPGADV